MDIRYKLVTQDYKTMKGTSKEMDWSDCAWKEATGFSSKLCSSGVIHSYESLEIALFMNPSHANIVKPRLLEVECENLLAKDGTKAGYKRMRKIREICSFKEPTITQRIAFGILCALQVYTEPGFCLWAKAWLLGKNRGWKAASDAAYAAYAADAAAYAAATAAYAADAAYAAVYAADAAAYAAAAAAYAADAAAITVIKDFSLINIASKAMKY